LTKKKWTGEKQGRRQSDEVKKEYSRWNLFFIPHSAFGLAFPLLLISAAAY
jgi:hypothetical protein